MFVSRFFFFLQYLLTITTIGFFSLRASIGALSSMVPQVEASF